MNQSLNKRYHRSQRILIISICFLLFQNLAGQKNTAQEYWEYKIKSISKSEILNYGDISRIGIYADSIGNYKQVLIQDKSVVNAGDFVIIDFFITGYGHISGAKLNITPNAQIVGSDSYFEESLSYGPGNGNAILQKTENHVFSGENTSIFLLDASVKFQHDKKYITIFSGSKGKKLDSSQYKETEILFTEKLNKNLKGEEVPPLRIHLKTNDKAPSGDYKINFTLSYFNGKSFQVDQEHANIRIMPWYEKWAGTIEFLGFLIAIGTIINFSKPFINLINTVYGFIKKGYNRLKKLFNKKIKKKKKK